MLIECIWFSCKPVIFGQFLPKYKHKYKLIQTFFTINSVVCEIKYAKTHAVWYHTFPSCKEQIIKDKETQNKGMFVDFVEAKYNNRKTCQQI